MMEYYPNIEMNEELALFIKDLRVTQGYSWRAVDRDFNVKYIPEDKWWCNPAALKAGFNREQSLGHQIAGMELCQVAMEFLNEDIEDGWN